MKRYLTSVLILSSLLPVFLSCGSLHHLGYRKEVAVNRVIKPVFPPDFDKSLYSVKIIFGDNVFTSLAVIKYIPEDRSFRLALLSEAGMRLFEIEFLKDGSSQVNYTSDFMDRKAVVKKLSSDFGLLFLSGSENIVKSFSSASVERKYVLRLKKDGLKDYYFSPDVEGPEKASERGCIFGRTTVILNKYGDKGPQEIVFTHKMLKFEISLKRIDYSGWN
jgi:hypothetical protein